MSKTRPILLLSFALLILSLSACRKNFQGFLEQGRKSFEEKNYINTVDSLNVGLLHWRESDGNENKAEVYELLGQSYRYLRNTDKAVEAYREAIKLSTRTFTSAYELGMIQLAKNQIPSATDAFQKALQMNPDDPMSLLGLGHCYYAGRHYKDAEFTYQRVLEVSPGVRDALESLSLTRNHSGQKTKSVSKKSSASSYKAPVKPVEKNAVIKKKPKKKK